MAFIALFPVEIEPKWLFACKMLPTLGLESVMMREPVVSKSWSERTFFKNLNSTTETNLIKKLKTKEILDIFVEFQKWKAIFIVLIYQTAESVRSHQPLIANY